MSDMPKQSDDKLPFFLAKNSGLGTIRPEDELLHPDSFKGVPDDSATETQYFGFSVPEENIHSLCYMWWHPNLRVVSGGIYVFQGVKTNWVHAELCDWRTFMSDKALAKDLHEFRLDNGYGVEVLVPNKRFHITYEGAAEKNSVDLIAEAVQPGVMFGDGRHFDQAMRMKGKLTLRGKEYAVDCYSVRDRSWGKPRPETLMGLPPMSWMSCTFNDKFSFNCTMLDHASGQPERGGIMVVPDSEALICGWVHQGGKLGRIVKGNKRVLRGPGSTACAAIHLQFTDEHGRDFAVDATLKASCPMPGWPSAMQIINLMRFECNGTVGYGDCQEVIWGNYLNSPIFKATK